MEVSYKKDMNKSYMLVKGEFPTKDYKIRMVCNNKIPGFNKVSIKQFNNETIIYYDISGKMSMTNEYAVTKMKAKDIRNYVMGIQSMVESVRQYMLDLDKVILDLEFVYLKQNDKQPQFCYYPEKNENFYQSLQKVFDKIIEIADHSDRETIIVSYGLQQLRVDESNVTLNDIMKFLSENKLINEDKLLSENKFINEGKLLNQNKFLNHSKLLNENKRLNENKQKEREYSTDKYQYIEKNGLEYLCDEETVYGEESFHKTISLVQKIKEMIWGSKTKIADGEARSILHKSETISKLKERFENLKKRYQTEEEILAEQEKIYDEELEKNTMFGKHELQNINDEADEAGETVLLRTGTMQCGIVLKCTDIERAQTIVPNDFPCILGKSKKSADYIIDDKTISRVHVRLHEEETGYYVEDLNSTNGTYVNNEKLAVHELRKINIGDTIKLSEIEYVVC